MDRDARLVRDDGPFLFTDCRAGQGIEAIIEHLELARSAAGNGARHGRLRDPGLSHGHVHVAAAGGRIGQDAP
jgi:hypothetical protein